MRPAGPTLGAARVVARPRALAALAAILGAILCAWAWIRPAGAAPDRVAHQAEADARAGRFPQADAALQQLARLRPPTPADRLLRAQVAGALGRTDRAVAELAAIPDADPLAPLARLSAGQLEARRGRLRHAEAAFLATLALAPQGDQARRELVYIYSAQQRLPELDAQLDALARRGALDLTHLVHWGMIRQAEWAAATDLPALRRYLAADADDRATRLALDEALWRTGDPEDAQSALAPLPASDPDARAARARIALDRGDRAAAEALLAGGPADHAGLARLRSRLALSRGDLPGAVALARAALAADPGDHAGQHALAVALAAAGDPTPPDRSATASATTTRWASCS